MRLQLTEEEREYLADTVQTTIELDRHSLRYSESGKHSYMPPEEARRRIAIGETLRAKLRPAPASLHREEDG